MSLSTPLVKKDAKKERLELRLLRHHLPIAIVSLLAGAGLYGSLPGHDWISKVSMSSAYVSLALIGLTLAVGPWRTIMKQKMPVSQDLRRDLGIWAGITGLLHTVVGINVHLRGRPWLYFIYEHPERHAFPLRHDQFGFANESGLIASLLLAMLLATSNDWSLRRLGTPGWKKLQRWSYGMFALVVLHGILFQLVEKQRLPLVLTFAMLAGSTIVIQSAGYLRRRRSSRS